MLDGSCQIAFSPGAKHIAIPCEDRLDVLDTITGQNVLCIGQMAKPISVAFSPDGQRIASGGSDGTLWVWDTMKGEKVASYKSNEEGELTSLCFCHDGDIIAAGCERGVILLFDATTGKQLLCLRGHTGSVICLTFSPDRRCLASADITYGSDETVRLWDLQRGREIYYLPIFATSLEFSPDGKRIVIAAGGACEVQMWGTEIPQQSGCIKLEYFTCASFSSYGNSIVLGELGNRVLVRDLRRVLPIIASRKMQGGGLL
jgi:WD40 repeat protein